MLFQGMDLSGMKKVGADGQPEEEEEDESEKTFFTKITSLPWWCPLLGLLLFELEKDYGFKAYRSQIKRESMLGIKILSGTMQNSKY
jgi:hypothetical protein